MCRLTYSTINLRFTIITIHYLLQLLTFTSIYFRSVSSILKEVSSSFFYFINQIIVPTFLVFCLLRHKESNIKRFTGPFITVKLSTVQRDLKTVA